MTKPIKILQKHSRGAIHLFAILACFLLLFALFLLSQWIKKIDNVTAKIVTLEKTVDGLESKVKYLELKLAADDLKKND